MEELRIDIDNAAGVSPVGEDTRKLAKYVSGLKFKTAIDIGTGTGYIPIYLKKLGFDAEGTDITLNALDCAKKNAEKNNVDIRFYYSDLFENIKKKFDVIIFNPPLGSFSSNSLTKYLELVKSLFPKENKLVSKISFQFVKKQRKKMINRFLKDAGSFLNKNGKVIILLHKSELELVKNFSTSGDKVEVGDARVVLLAKEPNI